MKLTVKLKPSIRKILASKCRGSTPVRVAKRARALLCLDDGLGVTETSALVGCGTATVKRVRRNFLAEGYERAIFDQHRGGRARALDEKQTQELIALACTDAPQGYARWTISLLAAHFSPKVCRATIHKVLVEDGLKPWREKNVVRSHN